MQENVELIFTLQSRSLICEILKNTFSPFKSSTNKARMAKNRHTTDTANSQHLEKMTSGACGLPRLLALQCCKNVYRKTHVRLTAGEWQSKHTPQLKKKNQLHSEPDLLDFCDTAIAGPMRSQIHFFRAVSFSQSRAKKKISRPPADISAQ